jgi:hypothetical protein
MFDVTLVCTQGKCGEVGRADGADPRGAIIRTVRDVDSRKRNGFDVLEAMRLHEVEHHGGKSR